MRVASVSEMRAMDSHAIEVLGIAEALLMENAGLASCRVLQELTGIAGRRFTVLCGAGNNGGDGFVVARWVHANGGEPLVLLLGNPERFRGAARANLEIIQRLPVQLRQVTAAAEIRKDLAHSHAIVDAIFGTGLDRPVSGIYRDVIELVNEVGRPVLSLDIPSGIHGDTGQIMGTAVRAHATVSFGLPKIGNLLFPGFACCGKLAVTHITFPPSLYERPELKVRLNDHVALPVRERTVHKGQVGDALFIAGATNYYGAPYFAAMSHLKAGGGYSRLAAPAPVIPVVAGRGSEIVFAPLTPTAAGSVAGHNKEYLLQLAAKVDMVVLGPGLSREEQTQQLVRELAATIEQPLLLDGDGLTAIAGRPELIRGRPAPTVLTPHTGEMGRLTGRRPAEIEVDRIAALREAAATYGAVVVMKGAHTLVGTPGGEVYVNMSGNPGMATAGAGDVLTGTVTAMVGLGLPLVEAVRKAVFLHGAAGDLAAEAKGEDGITGDDILTFLPAAVQADRAGWAGRYELPVVL